MSTNILKVAAWCLCTTAPEEATKHYFFLFSFHFKLETYLNNTLYLVSGVVRQKTRRTPLLHDHRICVILGTFFPHCRTHEGVASPYCGRSLAALFADHTRIARRGVCVCLCARASHKEAIASSLFIFKVSRLHSSLIVSQSVLRAASFVSDDGRRYVSRVHENSRNMHLTETTLSRMTTRGLN